jgi:tRNA pseudouridine55 synthase
VASKQSHLHGILVVDKPGLPAGVEPGEAGYLLSSHDVVQRVRRWSGERRIGHTGTLDPMASGVLILCLGAATRLVEYYQGHDKHYLATVQLGIETDTHDAMGQVVDQQPVPDLAIQEIESTLDAFRGAIAQIPPVYSALKQGGESLYRKARRGEEIEVEARSVFIHHLSLVDFQPPALLQLKVHCSAGTYIRSLARDLGQALGSCAHLRSLRREAAGEFAAQDAHPLETIEAVARQGSLETLLLPPGIYLKLPTLVLEAEPGARLGHGQKVWLPAPEEPSQEVDLAEGALLQGIDEQGRLLGILRLLQRSPAGHAILCKADKWLAPHLGGSPS